MTGNKKGVFISIDRFRFTQDCLRSHVNEFLGPYTENTKSIQILTCIPGVEVSYLPVVAVFDPKKDLKKNRRWKTKRLPIVMNLSLIKTYTEIFRAINDSYLIYLSSLILFKLSPYGYYLIEPIKVKTRCFDKIHEVSITEDGHVILDCKLDIDDKTDDGVNAIKAYNALMRMSYADSISRCVCIESFLKENVDIYKRLDTVIKDIDSSYDAIFGKFSVSVETYEKLIQVKLLRIYNSIIRNFRKLISSGSEIWRSLDELAKDNIELRADNIRPYFPDLIFCSNLMNDVTITGNDSDLERISCTASNKTSVGACDIEDFVNIGSSKGIKNVHVHKDFIDNLLRFTEEAAEYARERLSNSSSDTSDSSETVYDESKLFEKIALEIIKYEDRLSGPVHRQHVINTVNLCINKLTDEVASIVNEEIDTFTEEKSRSIPKDLADFTKSVVVSSVSCRDTCTSLDPYSSVFLPKSIIGKIMLAKPEDNISPKYVFSSRISQLYAHIYMTMLPCYINPEIEGDSDYGRPFSFRSSPMTFYMGFADKSPSSVRIHTSVYYAFPIIGFLLSRLFIKQNSRGLRSVDDKFILLSIPKSDVIHLFSKIMDIVEEVSMREYREEIGFFSNSRRTESRSIMSRIENSGSLPIKPYRFTSMHGPAYDKLYDINQVINQIYRSPNYDMVSTLGDRMPIMDEISLLLSVPFRGYRIVYPVLMNCMSGKYSDGDAEEIISAYFGKIKSLILEVLEIILEDESIDNFSFVFDKSKFRYIVSKLLNSLLLDLSRRDLVFSIEKRISKNGWTASIERIEQEVYPFSGTVILDSDNGKKAIGVYEYMVKRVIECKDILRKIRFPVHPPEFTTGMLTGVST